jgi:DNA-3-methyladenine glycosylase
MHYLVNAVTEPAGDPAAILIRALEPLEGALVMRRRRERRRRAAGTTGRAPLEDSDLCRGPGNLTVALGIDLRQNTGDLTSGTACHRRPRRAAASTGEIAAHWHPRRHRPPLALLLGGQGRVGRLSERVIRRRKREPAGR